MKRLVLRHVLLTSLVVATTFAMSAFAQAADLSAEIAQLNREYSGALGYPIIIVDKTDFQKFMAKHNAANTDNESLLARGLYTYIRDKHGYTMTPGEAGELADYFTPNYTDASAMPFFTERVRFEKLKYCVVIPSSAANTPIEEIKRITGADGHPELFHNFDFNKAAGLMTQEQIQLFSLYHELSHCLDRTYLRAINEFEVDPHSVHEAEAFAEVNALFLLQQRKDLKNIGASRSLLRTLYSKYYGPALAQSRGSFFSNPAMKAGGSIYFLSPVLLPAQKEIELDPKRIQSLTLEQTLALSKLMVEQHSMDARSFQALNMMLTDGPEKILPHYRNLAQKRPDLFLRAYQNLLYYKSVFDSLDGVFTLK